MSNLIDIYIERDIFLEHCPHLSLTLYSDRAGVFFIFLCIIKLQYLQVGYRQEIAKLYSIMDLKA